MLKTSFDRKVFVFASIVLYTLLCILFPGLLLAWLAIAGTLGTVGIAVFLYDWILAADEALFEEAEEQRRQRGQ